MALSARYVHTNLVAQNWKALARFYEQVFGCTRMLPERNLSGAWLEAATAVPAVDDVASARESVLAAGGGEVGEVTTIELAGAGEMTFVYLADPEGNVLELQQWTVDN